MKESWVFIYAKNNKIKCLSLDESMKRHVKLINAGWDHTQTLDACAYIESLYNSKDAVNEIKLITKNL